MHGCFYSNEKPHILSNCFYAVRDKCYKSPDKLDNEPCAILCTIPTRLSINPFYVGRNDFCDDCIWQERFMSKYRSKYMTKTVQNIGSTRRDLSNIFLFTKRIQVSKITNCPIIRTYNQCRIRKVLLMRLGMCRICTSQH